MPAPRWLARRLPGMGVVVHNVSDFLELTIEDGS
jgi:hypothetical protein